MSTLSTSGRKAPEKCSLLARQIIQGPQHSDGTSVSRQGPGSQSLVSWLEDKEGKFQ